MGSNQSMLHEINLGCPQGQNLPNTNSLQRGNVNVASNRLSARGSNTGGQGGDPTEEVTVEGDPEEEDLEQGHIEDEGIIANSSEGIIPRTVGIAPETRTYILIASMFLWLFKFFLYLFLGEWSTLRGTKRRVHRLFCIGLVVGCWWRCNVAVTLDSQ